MAKRLINIQILLVVWWKQLNLERKKKTFWTLWMMLTNLTFSVCIARGF